MKEKCFISRFIEKCAGLYFIEKGVKFYHCHHKNIEIPALIKRSFCSDFAFDNNIWEFFEAKEKEIFGGNL